jgi:Cdc6-like AAA superfamily ATPase
MFEPYTHDQINAILRQCAGGNDVDCLNVKAIEFIGRKVAAVTGDMRKAIDMFRRAVDLALADGDAELKLSHVRTHIGYACIRMQVQRVIGEAAQTSVARFICALGAHELLVMRAALVSAQRADSCVQHELASNYIDLCNADGKTPVSSDFSPHCI